METQIEHNKDFTQLLFSQNIEKTSSQAFTLFPISFHQNDERALFAKSESCKILFLLP
jgi:hypothetical protein